MSEVDEVARDVAEPEDPDVTQTVPVVGEETAELPAAAEDAPPEVEAEAEVASAEEPAEEPVGDTAGDAGGPAGDDGEEPLGFELPAPMSQMHFVDVVMVLPSTHPVVVLQEADFPYRELRIPVGGPEGIAIGYAGRQLPTPRPLTHELMTRVLESFGLTLDVVRITGMRGGMFTAELTLSGPTGQRVIDCRPSDGIALALRQPIPVPIMADPDVLDRAGGAAAGQN